MEAETVAGGASGSYRAATESLRSATKWLLAAAAAVGAVLIAGLQLGRLGALSWPRLLLALAGLLLALGAVGYMIWKTCALLTDDWIFLGQLSLDAFESELNTGSKGKKRQRSEDLRTIYEELRTHRNELYAHEADSPEDLYRQLIDANRDVRSQSPPPAGADQSTPSWIERRSGQLRQAAFDVAQFANYRLTRLEFDRLRHKLAWAAAVVVIGTVIFALAQPPDKKDSKLPIPCCISSCCTETPGPDPSPPVPTVPGNSGAR